MAIEFPCEHCGHTLVAVFTEPGQPLACPECKKRSVVPAVKQVNAAGDKKYEAALSVWDSVEEADIKRTGSSSSTAQESTRHDDSWSDGVPVGYTEALSRQARLVRAMKVLTFGIALQAFDFIIPFGSYIGNIVVLTGAALLFRTELVSRWSVLMIIACLWDLVTDVLLIFGEIPFIVLELYYLQLLFVALICHSIVRRTPVLHDLILEAKAAIVLSSAVLVLIYVILNIPIVSGWIDQQLPIHDASPTRVFRLGVVAPVMIVVILGSLLVLYVSIALYRRLKRLNITQLAPLCEEP
jgi:hypothetical protein